MNNRVTGLSTNSVRFNTLSEWLGWMESLHPTEIDLGLERVGEVASRMGLMDYISQEKTTHKLHIITVAGTNGKGSCVSVLEACLLAVDKTVGAYTSPHLLFYNERIKINGRPATDDQICEAFAAVDAARESCSLTYFEFGSLAAFYLFKCARVEYWLLEVGLGGRLDAVNVISPDIAVITSIAIDHEGWLGSDRETIAREKAGVLRDNISFVCADEHPPQTLIDAAATHQCNYYQLGRHFSYTRTQAGTTIRLADEHVIDLTKCLLPLASVASALQVFSLLGFSKSLRACTRFLETLAVPGRFSIHHATNGVRVIMDVAHNPAASNLLADKLANQFGQEPVVAVVAMMADKDIENSLRPLIARVDLWYLLDLSANPRAARQEELQAILLNLGVESQRIMAINRFGDILLMAQNDSAHRNVLVFGSFYTVAQALTELQEVRNG